MELAGKFIETYPVFLRGMLLTFELTIVSVFIAIFIGLFFAFLKISRIKVLEWIADIYIFLVRGTPLVVQIFIFYFGLTSLNISQFLAVVLGLAFHNGAYIAEIFRGSIQSIEKGQMEAGRSLGMSAGLAMRRIILPQAVRRALPPLGNQFIIALKDSSLASFIGMYELFNVATTYGSNEYDYMSYLLIVAVYYLILVLVFSFLVSIIEKRMAISD
ncbi:MULTISPECIES: amino acid ABC transporter permease [Bacillaceae]|uniref:Cystine transporter permease n=2 Tax=Bacillus infantis TaxID=324767 RepID=U5LGM7_9BACI|nr:MULTISPECIES: amino acid ABC transporter permease [Bacillus]OXT18926.1 cystine transporter permease [Bacillus sp. OG2]AGX05722.1 cystine transporter permease [Bacillus infantis NRRL B-14911]EAR65459.1 amino acid ABC transproter, permease [Bacillus sp. NRRL B-14911]MCA1036429.1 amino acid ABC transporter permease [Bacillus infantis]MCK6205005.1 amino acid ABC transporter permease [Bacillus infantis]